MNDAKWVKVIIVVMVVFAVCHLVQVVANLFHLNLPSTTYGPTASIIVNLVMAALFILLAVSLKLAHDKKRPSLYLPFLIVNMVLIVLTAIALVFYVLSLVGMIAVSATSSSSSSANRTVKGTTTATAEPHPHMGLPALIVVIVLIVLSVVMLAVQIFFEKVVCRAWRTCKAEVEMQQQQRRSMAPPKP